jgi:hypothetical protein
MSAVEAATAPAVRSEARIARSERFRLLIRTPTVLIGAIVVGFWVFCAVFPGLVAPYNPIFDNQFPISEPPSWEFKFGPSHCDPIPICRYGFANAHNRWRKKWRYCYQYRHPKCDHMY